ncbi:unnamed protein product [Oppiella nova]|uniref:C2H2-type domain-containing protein n=1 Tax=Oppiella nova TaxID=334625 RepID=A0A7R9QMP6_9ACAR|nr:unnamed protein product [Oppiella nova]CAG2168355.1 unnamed protein product [Oppiella nova]
MLKGVEAQIRIIFQCTWPGCVQQYDTCKQIEHHVRTKHLGRSGETSDENNDREEEFYYTEIEVMDGQHHHQRGCDSLGSSSSTSPSSVSSSSSSPGPQSPTASNDGSCKSEAPSPHLFFPSTSAPPTVWSHLEDHEYPKPLPLSGQQHNLHHYHSNGTGGGIKIKFIDTNTFLSNNKALLTAPINIPGLTTTVGAAINAHQYSKPMPISISAPVSLQSPARPHHKYMKLNGGAGGVKSAGSSGTTLLHAGPAKQSPTKRVRGESRKCRKVYGMDNRDSWCTQCKWKKACSRFTD